MLDIEHIAKKIAKDDLTDILADHSNASDDDFYVVWKSKTLQNWKCLVSTDVVNGFYWEITYNGDKNEAYVDRYYKANNKVISSEEMDVIGNDMQFNRTVK